MRNISEEAHIHLIDLSFLLLLLLSLALIDLILVHLSAHLNHQSHDQYGNCYIYEYRPPSKPWQRIDINLDRLFRNDNLLISVSDPDFELIFTGRNIRVICFSVIVS